MARKRIRSDRPRSKSLGQNHPRAPFLLCRSPTTADAPLSRTIACQPARLSPPSHATTPSLPAVWSRSHCRLPALPFSLLPRVVSPLLQCCLLLFGAVRAVVRSCFCCLLMLEFTAVKGLIC
ncbi:WD_REPEATS_REGION domain-containing protein [Psidium guajava]|nr:WD_REPEATS_REGION domain-containing protein [Psidium guajava]